MTQRIALVTGGMGGLGETICMKIARMGIKVVVTYSPGNTKHKEWIKEMEGRDYHFAAYPATCPTSIPARRWSSRWRRRSAPSTSSSTTPASRAT